MELEGFADELVDTVCMVSVCLQMSVIDGLTPRRRARQVDFPRDVQVLS